MGKKYDKESKYLTYIYQFIIDVIVFLYVLSNYKKDMEGLYENLDDRFGV